MFNVLCEKDQSIATAELKKSQEILFKILIFLFNVRYLDIFSNCIFYSTKNCVLSL